MLRDYHDPPTYDAACPYLVWFSQRSSEAVMGISLHWRRLRNRLVQRHPNSQMALGQIESCRLSQDFLLVDHVV